MRFLPIFLVLVAGCGATATAIEAGSEATEAEVLHVSMSLYIIDDTDGGQDSPLSSRRRVSEIDQIAERMNMIWGQAGVDLVVETIARIDAPADVLLALRRGETSSFLGAVATGAISVPQPATINGFYVARIGTANGMTPFGTRLFFVADEPSVNDERVSSHEIGHIFGLHHTRDDADRLMFSGTNGTDLTEQEVAVARYGAKGLLDDAR